MIIKLDGMGEFLKSELFRQMGPIAIAFDEGLANPENVYTGTKEMNLLRHAI